jgi:hypothetical protein
MKREPGGADRSSSWNVPPLKEAIVDPDGSAWDKRAEEIVEKYKHIIVLRGAGSVNGIDKQAADGLLEKQILPRVREALENGGAAVMFDGDPDSPDAPDIGYIMGRIADELKQESEERAALITAQKKSWYYPSEPGKNLANSQGVQYGTYVFEDGKFAGDHNRFTQSDKLVNASGFEEWYIGASGPIASEQLADYNEKVSGEGGRKQKAVMFRVPLNEALTEGINAKLADAREAQDEKKIAKFEGALEQRRNKFGVHWDNGGRSTINVNDYPRLDFEFVEG